MKRHFQKCSIRRGNPTGASHLSHAQAHLKKSHPGPHKSTGSMSNDNELMGVNGMANMSDPALHPFGVIPDGSVPDAGSNLTAEQAEQANNMSRRGRDGGSMANLGPGGTNQAFNQGYGGMGNGMPPSAGMNPSIAFSVPNGQNGHSYSAQGYDYAAGNQSVAGIPNLPNARNSISLYAGNNARQQPNVWSQVFQPNLQSGFTSPYNTTFSNAQIPIKTEASMNNSTTGLYHGGYPGTTHPIAANSDYSKWNIPTDYYQEIANRLIFFCFPQNDQITSRSNAMRAFLSADNIKLFLAEFSNFQTHFPIVHMPTFRITEAYDGLVLAMICIGAVYSNHMAATQARDIMEFAKEVTERNSQIYSTVLPGSNGSKGFEHGTFALSNSEIEQITAILLMQVLFTWHGTPIQREKARQQFTLLVALAGKTGLMLPQATSPFSPLHQPNVVVEHFNVANFEWNIWVQEEKRCRLMYTISLVDTALAVYFNTPPLLEKLEIKVPLPADDAAWEARSSTECAEALGLYGPALAQTRNRPGARFRIPPSIFDHTPPYSPCSAAQTGTKEEEHKVENGIVVERPSR